MNATRADDCHICLEETSNLWLVKTALIRVLLPIVGLSGIFGNLASVLVYSRPVSVGVGEW